MGSTEVTRTTALFPSAVFVQWDIAPSEAGDHYVDVFRSGSPEGPWEPLAEALRNAYHFLDADFNRPQAAAGGQRGGLTLLSLSREVYYKVRVTPPSGTSNAFSSPPVAIDPGLDTRTRLLKRKILRDEATAFRRLNGIPLVVLKRRHWGTHCSDCYDHVTREATLEHCRVCYGTAYRDGYWAPVLVRGRKTPGPVQTQMTAHGESDMKAVNFILLDYPHLEHKDVLVDLRRNDRYQIQMVAATELKGVTIHQTATASLLARSSVEYSIRVDPTTTPPLY